MRHAQATQLLANGVDAKTVQARMGRANASITLNWYTHAVPENHRRAAQLTGGLLSLNSQVNADGNQDAQAEEPICADPAELALHKESRPDGLTI